MLRNIYEGQKLMDKIRPVWWINPLISYFWENREQLKKLLDDDGYFNYIFTLANFNTLAEEVHINKSIEDINEIQTTLNLMYKEFSGDVIDIIYMNLYYWVDITDGAKFADRMIKDISGGLMEWV